MPSLSSSSRRHARQQVRLRREGRRRSGRERPHPYTRSARSAYVSSNGRRTRHTLGDYVRQTVVADPHPRALRRATSDGSRASRSRNVRGTFGTPLSRLRPSSEPVRGTFAERSVNRPHAAPPPHTRRSYDPARRSSALAGSAAKNEGRRARLGGGARQAQRRQRDATTGGDDDRSRARRAPPPPLPPPLRRRSRAAWWSCLARSLGSREAGRRRRGAGAATLEGEHRSAPALREKETAIS